MTTESQEAHEAALLKLLPDGVTATSYRLLKPTEYMLAQQFFNVGEAYGRTAVGAGLSKVLGAQQPRNVTKTVYRRMRKMKLPTKRQLVDWLQMTLCASVVVGCVGFLEYDDRRMKKQYVAECEARKLAGTTKADIDCVDAFWNAYKETFGR